MKLDIRDFQFNLLVAENANEAESKAMEKQNKKMKSTMRQR